MTENLIEQASCAPSQSLLRDWRSVVFAPSAGSIGVAIVLVLLSLVTRRRRDYL
jgi:hypothetical protein